MIHLDGNQDNITAMVVDLRRYTPRVLSAPGTATTSIAETPHEASYDVEAFRARWKSLTTGADGLSFLSTLGDGRSHRADREADDVTVALSPNNDVVPSPIVLTKSTIEHRRALSQTAVPRSAIGSTRKAHLAGSFEDVSVHTHMCAAIELFKVFVLALIQGVAMQARASTPTLGATRATDFSLARGIAASSPIQSLLVAGIRSRPASTTSSVADSPQPKQLQRVQPRGLASTASTSRSSVHSASVRQHSGVMTSVPLL
jgi:hypothetical protein